MEHENDRSSAAAGKAGVQLANHINRIIMGTAATSASISDAAAVQQLCSRAAVQQQQHSRWRASLARARHAEDGLDLLEDDQLQRGGGGEAGPNGDEARVQAARP